MQDRLGVTGRLVDTVEDELLGSLETDGLVEVRGHRQVRLIALVLAVNDLGHTLKRIDDLLLGDNTVQQPVSQSLGGNTQGSAVLHQVNIVDVRHLGAANTLLNPADNVAQDGLAVTIQLVSLVLIGPAWMEV